MGKSTFSVSMCVYHGDSPDWFRQAADSVLNQTAKPCEVVLVVDGPVPEALNAVIQEYETKPVFRVIRLAENRGHGNARRVCLSHCNHELVALMDADDISLPDRFEKQLALFNADPELSAAGGCIAEFVDTPDNCVGRRTVRTEDADIRRDLRKRCPFNQSTMMLKKSHVLRAGGYLDWYCNEDYYLWVRMHLAGMKFANSPDVLVYARTGADLYRRRGGWRYFQSEAELQGYMLKNRIISPAEYGINVAKRLVVQVLLPDRLRGLVFRAFAREPVNDT